MADSEIALRLPNLADIEDEIGDLRRRTSFLSGLRRLLIREKRLNEVSRHISQQIQRGVEPELANV